MTADTVGGVWTYALELTRALARHGIAIGLATMGAPMSMTQKAEAAAESNLTLFESAYKLEWMTDSRRDVERAGHWLLELEQSFQPDLVHLNGFAHGALPWECPRLVVGHSCVLSWWRAVRGSEAPAEWDDYREGVITGLQAADLVVAPSRTMLQSLIRDYGPFKRSRVIYNGRRLPSIKPRKKHDLVFAAGRLWDDAKNIGTLATAAKKLEWPVLIAGAEADPDGNLARFRNLSCLGNLSPTDMAGALQRAAIYALPARYEPFGLSALEAALSHCALVLGDIPSLREIWEDAAVYVDPDDAVALQATLSGLIADPHERARLADAAFAQAQRYTPETMADVYMHAYAELLARRVAAANEPEAAPAVASSDSNAAPLAAGTGS